MWVEFIKANECKVVAELGVFKGAFAETVLKECPSVEKYVMIDPWRHLEDWNKPANAEDDIFKAFYEETMQRTDFAKEKRVVLRGKTVEIIDQIEDNSLDFVYIDGDHTLKGIAIDLVNMWDKVRPGGFIAGDDFSPTMWQHVDSFEPTLVYPFSVYFAEARRAKIFGFPYEQFVMIKNSDGYEFIDKTGKYPNPSIEYQLKLPRKKGSTQAKIGRAFPFLTRLKKKILG